MRILSAIIILILLPAVGVLGVGLPAGTTIELVAEGTYYDSVNQLQTAQPASATLTVLQVAGVLVDTDPSPTQATPGQSVYVPMQVHNTGNGIDSFNLTAQSDQAWQVAVVYDDNADGIHQDTEQSVITTAGMMIADGYTPCFAMVTVPADAEVGTTVTVTARSSFDPVGAWTSAQIELEAPDLPSVTISSPTLDPAYATTSPTISISGTASSGLPISGVTWVSDQGPGGDCTGTSEWAASDIALQPGDNIITVTMTDSAGRTGTDQLTVTFTDVGAPTVAIASPTGDPAYGTESPKLAIAGSATDNTAVASVAWTNDRGGAGLCAGTTSWSASDISLQPGVNIITVTATDESGNSGCDVLRVTCSHDAAIPEVQITSPTTGQTHSTNDPTLTIAGTASDDVSVTTVAWSNDRGGSGTCTGATAWSATGIALAIGQNIITVTATDPAGKTGTATLTVTYTGANAPTVQTATPTSDPAYSTTAASVSIAGTAVHDAGVQSVAWTNNRGGSGACAGTTSWSASGIPLAPGQNVIVVTATATTGNTGTDTLVITRTSPEVTITSPTTSISYTTDRSPLTISGTALDDAAVTAVSWSNSTGGSGTCTGTTSWSTAGIQLAQGQNVITITASDAASNTAVDVITVTYSPIQTPQIPQDTTAPTVHILSPTAEASCTRNCPTATVSGTASDDQGVAIVTWANEATGKSGSCTVTGSTWSAAGIELVVGDNPITITAQDAVGNAGLATVTIGYVDTAPGTAWNGLAMVSLPIIPDSADPKAACGFQEDGWCAFMAASNTYAVYPDQATWFAPADQTPGRGFWAYFETPATPFGVVPPQDQPATIHLAPGWNLIGQPFVAEVNWSLSAVTVRGPDGLAKPLGEMGTVCAPFLWGWTQDATDPSTGSYYLVSDPSLAPGVESRLLPWRGYWIKAYQECDLIIPAP